MNLNKRIIEQYEQLYAREEELYEKEVEKLESLPTAFNRGEWSREDLEWIIEWKVGVFTKPILKHLEKKIARKRFGRK